MKSRRKRFMSERLTEAIIILEDAAIIRDIYRDNPDPDAESESEEAVVHALLESGAAPSEVLRKKNLYTKFFKIIYGADS